MRDSIVYVYRFSDCYDTLFDYNDYLFDRYD